MYVIIISRFYFLTSSPQKCGGVKQKISQIICFTKCLTGYR